MATTIELHVALDVDGVPIPGYPLRRTLELGTLHPFAPIPREVEVSVFRPGPAEQLHELKLLAIQPDQDVTVRLSAQSDHGIPVLAGGLLLFFDAGMCNDPRLNVTIRNDSDAVAYINGATGGDGGNIE